MSSSRSRSFAAKAAPTVLSGLCLIILGWASLRANAAWHFLAARTIAEPLFVDGGGTPAQFAEAEYRVGKALSRFPNNPDYIDFNGRLKALAARQPGVVGAERRELLQSAADDFRRSTGLRPLWPYSWANLLSVKDKLGEVDSEFNTAMDRAAATGPWEPRVQLQVIGSGLRHWQELGQSGRDLVMSKSADALRIQPRELFELARDYGRPDLVCGSDGGHRQIERWCTAVAGSGGA